MNYPIWRQSRRFLGGYLIYKLLIYRQSLNEFVTVMGIAISKACNRNILPKTEDVARRVKEEGRAREYRRRAALTLADVRWQVHAGRQVKALRPVTAHLN
jgi:hypothetical protein